MDVCHFYLRLCNTVLRLSQDQVDVNEVLHNLSLKPILTSNWPIIAPWYNSHNSHGTQLIQKPNVSSTLKKYSITICIVELLS